MPTNPNLPVRISAEVAVKSKRSDYVSILDPAAKEVLQTNQLQRFYGDPDNVAQAVFNLKTLGFSVSRLDRTSMTISANRELFEETFNVTFTLVDKGKADPDDSPSLIQPQLLSPTHINPEKETDPERQNALTVLKNVLSGVSLWQVWATPSVVSPTPPEKSLKPWPAMVRIGEINKTLSKDVLTFFEDQEKKTKGAFIPISIVDSGFFPHPFIKETKNIHPISPESPTEEEIKTAISIIQKTTLEEFKKYWQTINGFKPPPPDNKIKEIIEYDEIRLSDFPDAKKDALGHGTMVLAIADTIAHINAPEGTKAMIYAYKNRIGFTWNHTQPFNDTLTNNQAALREPIERSIKDGQGQSRIHSWSFNILNLDHINVIKGWITKAAKEYNHIFFLAAGNITPGTKNPLADIEDFIVVGGAYREGDKFPASNFTLTYEAGGRRVPDICGLCGPDKSAYLVLPTSPGSQIDNMGGEGWVVGEGGASGATPQVAAVCARMLRVCSWLKREHILKILSETATKLEGGSWYDPVNNKALTSNFQAGVVNPDLAVLVAISLNLRFSANKLPEDKDYKNALTWAKTGLLQLD